MCLVRHSVNANIIVVCLIFLKISCYYSPGWRFCRALLFWVAPGVSASFNFVFLGDVFTHVVITTLLFVLFCWLVGYVMSQANLVLAA